MVKFLREKETELKAKLAASGKKCEKGTKIVDTIDDISALLQPGRFAGGRQDDLMAIRLMGATADTAYNVEGYPIEKICQPGTGNNKDNKDEDEHDADGEDRYPEYRGSQAQLKAEKLVIAMIGIMTVLVIHGF
jgi:hypothetical protein